MSGPRDELTPEERALLARAVAAAPPPPEPHWGRYRAELRARLDRRRSLAARVRRWWMRPAPLAVSAGLGAALLLFAIQPASRPPVNGELASVEEAVIGARLGLLENYRVMERLDLLEELDVIRQLDTSSLREG